MFRKIALSSLAALAIASFAFTARATTSSPSTFDATAKVKTNCTFTSGTFGAIAFGDYDPLVTNKTSGTNDITASTTLSVNCTKGTSATLTLDAGANGFTDPARHMKNTGNADKLGYALTKPDATLVADSGATWKPTDNYPLPASTGRGNGIDVKVFGHLASGQDVSTGDYSDTVSATVNY